MKEVTKVRYASVFSVLGQKTMGQSNKRELIIEKVFDLGREGSSWVYLSA